MIGSKNIRNKKIIEFVEPSITLPEADEEKILYKWNPSPCLLPPKNFFQLFKDRVREFLKHNAIVALSGSLTYEELEARSNRLALYLKILGVKKGDIVGLSLGNDIHFIVGILAILKSGGVYLPLDPHYPLDRLDAMIEDSKPSLVITQSRFLNLYSKHSIALLNLDEKDDKAIEGEINNTIIDEEYFDLKMSLDDLAYVIYTSGSTGKPKGIAVSHRSLPNIGLSHRGFYPKKMRALISGGICFDASILIIFHTLLNGGCLFMCDYEADYNIDRLRHFICENEINYMICVPSLYSSLLGEGHSFPKMECVSLTGAITSYSLCELHSTLVPNAVLYNEYGPSECAIGTTIAMLYNSEKKQINRITVGRPLINTQVYILGENLQLLPVGARGEICIGGVGLAKEYLNKAELTARKFVWVDFNGQKIRLYRSGDLGRFLPNGEIEFLGRIENQISINGELINLGEIELALSQYPKVKDALVTVENEKIIAYVTTSFEMSIKDGLIRYLKGVLPLNMMPDAFVELDCFPLSPNGKIDKDILLSQHCKTVSESYMLRFQE